MGYVNRPRCPPAVCCALSQKKGFSCPGVSFTRRLLEPSSIHSELRPPWIVKQCAGGVPVQLQSPSSCVAFQWWEGHQRTTKKQPLGHWHIIMGCSRHVRPQWRPSRDITLGLPKSSSPQRSPGDSECKGLAFWVHYLAFQPWTKWLPFFLSQSLNVLNGNN